MKQNTSTRIENPEIDTPHLLRIAIYAANKSAEILLRHFRKANKVKVKSMFADFADIVSEADIESDKAIVQILREKTPQIAILSEESADKIDLSTNTWIVDPLDGTIAFTAGLLDFGISIGLVHNGKPVIGVIYLPGRKEMFWATSGNEPS